MLFLDPRVLVRSRTWAAHWCGGSNSTPNEHRDQLGALGRIEPVEQGPEEAALGLVSDQFMRSYRIAHFTAQVFPSSALRFQVQLKLFAVMSENTMWYK